MKAKLLGVLLLAVLPVFAFAAMASAQTFRSGQTANVSASEDIDGSAFVAGSAVDVAGNINGDLYCAGQNITISGDVDGDVMCAGQTVTFSGTATGDVRLAGQTVAINGDVKGSATVAGQTVTIEGGGVIGRDAALFGQSIVINGEVARDVTIGSQSATINTSVGRDVAATLESLTLGKDATIAGTLDYTAPSKLTKDGDATVGGKITYTEQTYEERQAMPGYNFAGAIMGVLMLVASAVVLALIFPREFHRTTDTSVASASQALLAVAVGLIAGIIMPFVIVLLMITIVGIPLALVLLVAWVLIVALSGAFAAYYLGRILWPSQTNAVLIMLFGAVTIAITLMIPILNVLIWFLAVWYGSGAILLQLKKLAAAPSHDMSPQPKKRSRA